MFLKVSFDSKLKIRLFLQHYIGDLNYGKIKDLYVSLVEKSNDLAELDKNVNQVISNANTKSDARFIEVFRKLHEELGKARANSKNVKQQ
jgi:hypothetical protein